MTATDDKHPSRSAVRIRLGLLSALLLAGTQLEAAAHVNLDTMKPTWLVEFLFVHAPYAVEPFYGIASALFDAPPVLLGIALVLPNCTPKCRNRLIVVGVASVFFCHLSVWPNVVSWHYTNLLIFFASCLAMCFVLRRAGFTIQQVSFLQRTQTPQPLQFHLKHLMFAAAGVGCMLMLPYWMAILPMFHHLVWNSFFDVAPIFLGMWIALSLNRMLLRACISAACLMCFAWILNITDLYSHRQPDYTPEVFIRAALAFVVFLIVRWCGYRLVRSSPVDSGEAPSVGSMTRQVQELP